VDGFNLFYGLKTTFGRRYHWLDLETLANGLMTADQSLVAVKYFTARVRNDPPAQLRQDNYLQALGAQCASVEVVEGRFQQKRMQCRSCLTRWNTYEEKESDVSLAVALVEDTATNRYDTALLISADSDLCPAVQSARRLAPAKRILAALPPNRRSPVLERTVDAVLHIDRAMLNQAQLPAEVQTSTGIKRVRPPHWT
jgi:hypothetical protein